MTGRIVVGVDGSEPSKRALRWAATLARATGSELDAVISWDVPIALAMAYLPADANLGKDTATYLDKTVDEVFDSKRPPGLRTIVHQGRPAQVLLDAANDAQLLVVGSRGHGGFAGLLLGSVSAVVAEHARCPVLVVHGDHEPLNFTS